MSDGSQYVCFKFDPDAFNDPAAMISQLNKIHFHFGAWQWPWMGHGCNLFSSGVTNKYFVMKGNNPAPTSGAWHGDPNPAAFDYTNPAAVKWWQGPGLNKELSDMGFEFWKLDCSLNLVNSPVNNGGTLFDSSKDLSHEYHFAAYDMSKKFALSNNPVAKTVGSARGFIMGKSGSPKHDQMPMWWTNDQQSTWGGLANEMNAASRLNTPDTAAYWGGDTGGYNGTPSDELYVRWAEYTTFTPIQEYFAAKTNGGLGNRFPWTFGTQAQTIIHQLNQLRYRLLPFRYSNAQAAYHAQPGKFTYPVGWFGGAAGLQAGDGSNTMFIQMVKAAGETSANVALPAGTWIHWWTNKSFTAAAAVDTPLGQPALFVKAGSILPMIGEYPGAPTIHWTDELPNDPLTLRIYPAGKTTNTFYEDDGISEGYQNGAFATTTFTSDNTGGKEVVTIGAQQSQKSFGGQLCQRSYIIELPGWPAAPTAVTQDGKTIASSTAFPSGAGWYYDAKAKLLWVRLAPLATSATSTISIQ